MTPHDPRHLHPAGSDGGSRFPGSCPDAMDLAAYLDGGAPADLAERIEVHLATCGACLAIIRQARADKALGDDSLVFVPAEVIAAAQSLVPAQAAGEAEPLIQIVRPGVSVWLTTVRRAAAIAAMVAIGAAGHHVGAALSASSAASNVAASGNDAAAAATVADVSFGVLDETDDSTAASDLRGIAFSAETSS